MVQPIDPVVIQDDDSTASEASAGNRAKNLPPAKRKLASGPISLDNSSDEPDGHGVAFKKQRAASKRSGNAKGKQKAAVRGRPSRKTAGYNARKLNDSTSSGNEPDISTSLPVYFQKRRTAFDESYKALHEAGLRLPPDYSDVYFSDDERLGDLEEKPQFEPSSGIKPCHPYKDIKIAGGLIPASLAQYLRDYQIQGVQFLYDLFVHQRGGILGDDMGLGKTVQVAAFLTVAFGKTGDSRDAKRMRKYRRAKDDWYPRVLIICPGSLIQN